MDKKYILATLATGFLLTGGFALAVDSINATATQGSSVDTSRAQSDSKVEVQIEAKNTGESPQGVLPTVNKVDSNNDGQESQRVLPTVNKKTTAKVTVRGWDNDKKEAVQGKVEEEVEKNPDINSVEITEEAVNVMYSVPGKFLGLIKMHMNTSVSSDNQGHVKVQFPWYRFLVTTDYARAAETINGVFQNNQSDFEFLKTKGSAEAQIEIFITISNSMHEMSKSIIQNIKA